MNQSHTQNCAVAYNIEPAITLSTSQVHMSSNTANEEQWKHFLSNIRPATSSKLIVIGVFYILIGIIAIGIEVRLLQEYTFGFYFGFLDGAFSISLGILTLILCRQQVYVLTNLFILVFFELLITIISFVFYCIALSIIDGDASHCLHSYDSCIKTGTLILLIIKIILCVITFSLLITNFILIVRARRPNIPPMTTNYVAYIPQTHSMPTSFQNPCAMTNSQQSLA
ncbi:hypothetical protein I4U23_008322 [Adineta vaga]|nr:hypothetical protein I4U23_008322 [Adineta vaga]